MAEGQDLSLQRRTPPKSRSEARQLDTKRCKHSLGRLATILDWINSLSLDKVLGSDRSRRHETDADKAPAKHRLIKARSNRARCKRHKEFAALYESLCQRRCFPRSLHTRPEEPNSQGCLLGQVLPAQISE